MDELELLLQEQVSLQEKIRTLREIKKGEIIASMKLQMKNYGIVISDLVDSPEELPKQRRLRNAGIKEQVEKKGKHPPKYRDPVTGKTWSGYGKPPNWIKGKNFADFRIDRTEAAS